MQVIERWLPRYLGFDPSEHWGRKWMKGRMYSPQWITLIGTQFIDKLGGTDRIAPALRGTEVKHLSNGIWVRASRLPPIGDINYFAEDIGQLPTVARLLKPLRTPELRFAYTQLNATKWLERFDDLPATDWDNT